MPHRRALVVSVAINPSVVVLAAFGAFAGLDRFVDRGIGWRLVAYPLARLRRHPASGRALQPAGSDRGYGELRPVAR